MTKVNRPDWRNALIPMIIPIVVLIGVFAVIHSQVGDLKVMMKETSLTIQTFSERLTKVETQVQFLYDERKKE